MLLPWINNNISRGYKPVGAGGYSQALCNRIIHPPRRPGGSVRTGNGRKPKSFYHFAHIISEGVCRSAFSTFLSWKNDSLVENCTVSLREKSQNLATSWYRHGNLQLRHEMSNFHISTELRWKFPSSFIKKRVVFSVWSCRILLPQECCRMLAINSVSRRLNYPGPDLPQEKGWPKTPNNEIGLRFPQHLREGPAALDRGQFFPLRRHSCDVSIRQFMDRNFAGICGTAVPPLPGNLQPAGGLSISRKLEIEISHRQNWRAVFSTTIPSFHKILRPSLTSG